MIHSADPSSARGARPRTVPLLRADMAANQGRPGVLGTIEVLLTMRFWAVLLFRCSQAVGRINPIAGSLIKQFNHLATGADLAWQADVAPGLVLYHPTGVVLGPHVRLGAHATVQQGVTLGGDGGADGGADSSPTIGDNAYLGAGCRVFGRITLGDNVKVGANAVVMSDVPDNSTVVGIPGRVIERENG